VYFVLGIYFAKNRPAFKVLHLVVASLATMPFVIYLIQGKYPSRFPPSVPWILGAMLFLYGYYHLAGAVSGSKYMEWLAAIGRNSLFYLLVSNIIIFALKSSGFYRISPVFASVLFLVVMVIIRHLNGLIRDPQRENAQAYGIGQFEKASP